MLCSVALAALAAGGALGHLLPVRGIDEDNVLANVPSDNDSAIVISEARERWQFRHQRFHFPGDKVGFDIRNGMNVTFDYIGVGMGNASASCCPRELAAVRLTKGSTLEFDHGCVESDGPTAIVVRGNGSDCYLDTIRIRSRDVAARDRGRPVVMVADGAEFSATHLDISSEYNDKPSLFSCSLASIEGHVSLNGIISETTGAHICAFGGDITVNDMIVKSPAGPALIVSDSTDASVTRSRLSSSGVPLIVITPSTSSRSLTGTDPVTAGLTLTDTVLEIGARDGAGKKRELPAAFIFSGHQDYNITLKGVRMNLNGNRLVTADFPKSLNSRERDVAGAGAVSLYASKSKLEGAIVADAAQPVHVILESWSSWNGTPLPTGIGRRPPVSLSLDRTSTLSLTAPGLVRNLETPFEDLDNVISNGHPLFYDAAAPRNAYLRCRVIELHGGGSAIPVNKMPFAQCAGQAGVMASKALEEAVKSGNVFFENVLRSDRLNWPLTVPGPLSADATFELGPLDSALETFAVLTAEQNKYRDADKLMSEAQGTAVLAEGGATTEEQSAGDMAEEQSAESKTEEHSASESKAEEQVQQRGVDDSQDEFDDQDAEYDFKRVVERDEAENADESGNNYGHRSHFSWPGLVTGPPS